MADFLTYLWAFWLCPSLFPCLWLKSPFPYPKYRTIASSKSWGFCVSARWLAGNLAVIHTLHFKLIHETCDNMQSSLIKIKAPWALLYSVLMDLLLGWIFLGIFSVLAGLPDVCYGSCLAYPASAKKMLFDSYFINFHDSSCQLKAL